MHSWREQQDGASSSEDMAGKTRSRVCPLCADPAWIYGALLCEECPAGGSGTEPVGQGQRRDWEGDAVMGYCYRPRGYGEEMDRDFSTIKGISGQTPWFSWGTQPKIFWMGGCGTQPVGSFWAFSR